MCYDMPDIAKQNFETESKHCTVQIFNPVCLKYGMEIMVTDSQTNKQNVSYIDL